MSTRRFLMRKPFTTRLLRRAGVPSSQPTTETGLTLLECLVAIVVVAMIGASIAPVMVLSVATRVQSQKAEQALQLAQSEVDRVKVLIERGSINDVTTLLPLATGDVNTVVEPGSLETDPDNLAFNEALSVDIDSDGSPDFAVQRFRVEETGVTTGFRVGVRVYDHRALVEGGNLGIEEAAIGFTTNDGERLEAPLAVLYTTAFASEQGESLCNFIDFSAASEGVTLAPGEKPSNCN